MDFLLHQDYIAKNLCENRDRPQLHCNGCCHLNKQLEKEDKKEQTPASPLKEQNEPLYFFQQQIPFKSPETSSLPAVSSPEKPFYFGNYLLSVFRPPQV